MKENTVLILTHIQVSTHLSVHVCSSALDRHAMEERQFAMKPTACKRLTMIYVLSLDS